MYLFRGSGTFTTCSFIDNTATYVSTTIIKTLFSCVSKYIIRRLFFGHLPSSKSSTFLQILYSLLCLPRATLFEWVYLLLLRSHTACFHSSFFHHFQHLVLAISFYVWTFSFRVSLQIFLIHFFCSLWSNIHRRVVGCTSLVKVLAHLLVVYGVRILLLLIR